ncbi:Succinyl-diaminopimelate desuccinylase [Pelomyxa schiedti]|nr:Succinyl-diaminopimelate desuccinylase [Pelomyxa schiedti]
MTTGASASDAEPPAYVVDDSGSVATGTEEHSHNSHHHRHHHHGDDADTSHNPDSGYVGSHNDVEKNHEEDTGTDNKGTKRRRWPLLYTQYFVRDALGFFILGTINNMVYVIINSSGQSLCSYFRKDDWIGAILWCNIALGFVARLVNAFFLENTSHGKRFIAFGASTIAGILMMIISMYADTDGQHDGFFILCLIGIIFAGTASSFGESVALGYLKHGFPPELVTAWSSGTGMAGVAGSGIYLILQAVELDDRYTFMALLPLPIVYILMYYLVIKVPDKKPAHQDEKSPLLQDPPINEVPEDTTETKKQRIWRCFKLSLYYATQLFLVYMFEYVASTGAADRSQDVDFHYSDNWFIVNSYVILGFCYQIGVLISRSSLILIKIKWVEVLTILQGINAVFWVLLAEFKFMEGDVWIWVQFVLMIYCGLLGGAMYVNVFYLILHDAKYPDKDRELCANITIFAQTIGITCASLIDIVFDNFLWPEPLYYSSLSNSTSMYLSASTSSAVGTLPCAQSLVLCMSLAIGVLHLLL